MIDHLVHTSPELIRDGTNGDIACNSYHKYNEDVALAKTLNVSIFFHSIYNKLYIKHKTYVFHYLGESISFFYIMGSNSTIRSNKFFKSRRNSILQSPY